MSIGEICDKYQAVMESCHTIDQYEIAQKYAKLVERALEQGGNLSLKDVLIY